MRFSPDGFAIGLAVLAALSWFVMPLMVIPFVFAAVGYWVTMTIVHWVRARQK